MTELSVRILSGHSGCEVKLISGDGVAAYGEQAVYKNTPYVRKTSSDTAYNTRLKAQCQKQSEYGAYAGDTRRADCADNACRRGNTDAVLHAPRVYASGYTESGLFYFDMEYIHGISLSEYMKYIPVSEIHNIVGLISAEFFSLDRTIDPSVFYKKINLLRESPQTARLADDSVFLTALRSLQAYDWRGFYESGCHGDMTFENIIVSGNKLYLIDFLDSFADSWILDAGKLLQDAQCCWSYRNSPKSDSDRADGNTLLRLRVFRELLIKKLCGRESASRLYLNLQYALLFHLVRIYPYTSDERTIEFLDREVSLVLGEIKSAPERVCA